MIQELPPLPALIPWIGGDFVVLDGELQEAIRKEGGMNGTLATILPQVRCHNSQYDKPSNKTK
jgi:hypothetical protein